MRYSLVEPYNGGTTTADFVDPNIIKIEWWLFMVIIIGVVVALVILIMGIYYCCLYKKAKSLSSDIYKLNPNRTYKGIYKVEVDTHPPICLKTRNENTNKETISESTAFDAIDFDDTRTVYNSLTNQAIF